MYLLVPDLPDGHALPKEASLLAHALNESQKGICKGGS